MLSSAVHTARGIHMWLVDVARPENNVFIGVCKALNSILQRRSRSQELEKWPIEEVESMTFSVLSFPPVRKKPPTLNIYILSPFEPFSIAEDEVCDDAVENLSSVSKTFVLDLGKILKTLPIFSCIKKTLTFCY